MTAAELDALVTTIHAKTDGQSREATGAAASNLDLCQVNSTYYGALGLPQIRLSGRRRASGGRPASRTARSSGRRR